MSKKLIFYSIQTQFFLQQVYYYTYQQTFNMQEIRKNPELKQAQETFQMMECGNIDLNFPIQYGILLLGNTKAGKTTTCHYLCQQHLEGDKNNAHSVVYKLKSGKKEYEGAKIGDQQSVSETQIPNFFINMLGGEKVYLVDCPGYLDSFGCYRIISNRFFHYQVFSKVENIKFIITFTYNDMLKTADKMLKTFRQFLRGFQNIQQIKQNLMKAISVMVTSVPKDKSLQDIISLFTQNHNVETSLESFYNELKCSLIEGKRIYMFEAAQLGKACNTKNNLLNQINSKSKFWKRSINQQKQVDMKNIKISITQYAGEDTARFNKQIKLVEQFYKLCFKKQIQNLIKVIEKLSQDCVTNEESATFISEMIKFTQQRKKWRLNQSFCRDLYLKYNEKRNKLKNSIFKTNDNLGSEKSYLANESPLWLCKFQTLRQIYNFSRQTNVFGENQRDIQHLNKVQQMVRCILQMLYILGKKKKEKIPAKDNEKNQAILDFVYQIYKNIIISNKLFILVRSGSEKEPQQQNSFILVQYPTMVKRLFLRGIREPFFDTFRKGLDNFDILSNITPKGGKQCAKFFQNYKNQIQSSIQIEKTITTSFLNILDNKIVSLNNVYFQSVKREATPKLNILQSMEKTRLQTFNKLKNYNFDNQSMKVQHNKIILLMAQCLYKNNYNKLAIQLYDALFNAHKLFELMQTQQEKIKKNLSKEFDYLDFLISYMKLAKKYHRVELALRKGQHALHIAQEKSQKEKISQISTFLKKLCQSRRENQSDLYQSHLFEEIVAIDLPKATSDKILKISKSP